MKINKLLTAINRRTFIYWKYLKEIKKLGLTFDEYCSQVYNNYTQDNSVGKSKLMDREILRTNKYWYAFSVLELFQDEVYKFETKNQNPVIIDCGSNIGLSIIYFNKLYPGSSIIGFEADQNLYNICKKNLETFNIKNIQLENAAVWKNEGVVKFKTDNNLGGKITDESSNEKLSEVKTVKLSKYLNRKIDFLKIDIEGSEFEVLNECQDYLHQVQRLFVEYHSSLHQEQQLDEILKIIKKAGFKYYMKEAAVGMKNPFVEHTTLKDGFNLQLNISCYRP